MLPATASIAGMAVTTVHNFGLSEGAELMGAGGVIFTAAIAVVAVLLFLYTRRMARRSLLG